MRSQFSQIWFVTILLFCLGLPTSVFAAKKSTEKWYEIELIIFAQDLATNFEAEIWEEKPGYPSTMGNIELYSPAELLLEDNLQALPAYLTEPETETEDNLNEYARRLKKSSKYELLVHRTWRQPVKKHKVYIADKPNTDPIVTEKGQIPVELEPEEKSAEEMLLQALLEEEKSFSQPLQSLPFFISELDQIQAFDDVPGMPEPESIALSYEGPPQHDVYGNFTLTKGRYLHMELDFIYRGEPYIPEPEELPQEVLFPMSSQAEEVLEPLPEEENVIELTDLAGTVSAETPPIVGYRIKQSKRVRLNRLYYFDHPLFGIVVRVIRYEPPPPEATEEVDVNSDA